MHPAARAVAVSRLGRCFWLWGLSVRPYDIVVGEVETHDVSQVVVEDVYAVPGIVGFVLRLRVMRYAASFTPVVIFLAVIVLITIAAVVAMPSVM